jgi:hypothetical protein
LLAASALTLALVNTEILLWGYVINAKTLFLQQNCEFLLDVFNVKKNRVFGCNSRVEEKHLFLLITYSPGLIKEKILF